MSSIKPIVMPRWGLEMTEGTLSAWHVAEGDRIEPGQVIMDVESEKIANEVEAEEGGLLRRIVVEAGDTVDIGALLGVIAPEEVSDDDVTAFVEGFRPVTGGHTEDDAKAPESAPAASPESSPPPSSVPRATAGDEPHASPTAKRLAKKLGVDISRVKGSGRNGRISADDVKAHAEGPGSASSGDTAPTADAGDGASRATPTAKRLARKLGVDLSQVKGTGRNGRISTEDVERAAADTKGGSAVEAPAATPAEAGDAEFDVIKQTTMRKTIARRLVESKQNVPHFYLEMDVEMDALLERRTALKSDGRVVSVNDCLVKACALALVDVPDANVQYHGDVVHRFRQADVAVAVATDGGLITPVVRAADTLDIEALSRQLRDLAERGRSGRLGAEEFQGGTLTLSNLGMYGIDAFSAVINPPQSAILAVGRANARVIARDGQPAVARVMTATLSCDHRAIDGALGARWLAAFRDRVEQPGGWLQ